jgi:hypothetical protein
MKRLPVDQLLERARAALDAVSAWLSPLQRRAAADAFLWRLQLAERVLWVILAGIGIYLVVDLFVLRLRPPTPASLTATSAGPGAGGEALTPGHLKPVAEYQQGIAARNPFGLTGRAGSSLASDQSQESPLQRLTASLAVVGINRGRIPEALIEDTEAKRTYFVKVGDRLNGLTVKAIDRRGVTVTYEGEELLLP